MHRNDLENIPIFLLIAILLYITSNADSSASAHVAYYIIFTVARFAHSFAFALQLQPWRSISYDMGLSVTFAAGIHAMVQAFNVSAL
eukprot:EC799494.1.p3 GENE.EC799494.1~~EC799494.1.p3  ORF type:complete len:87 (+),score=27.65 EC799494.1:458-718(+)